MQEVQGILGTYNIRARIASAVFVIAPIWIQFILLVPGIISLSGTIISTIVMLSFSIVIIVVSRKRGHIMRNKCFPDILPAQQFLLPDDTTIDDITKARYYDFLKSNLPSFSMDGKVEDQRIASDSAIKWLISITRDPQKYPLVFDENSTFGFSCNMLGMKPVGISISLISIIFSICHILFSLNSANSFDPKVICSMVFSFFIFLSWICLINKGVVRFCGEQYAHALLSAIDTLSWDSNAQKR